MAPGAGKRSLISLLPALVATFLWLAPPARADAGPALNLTRVIQGMTIQNGASRVPIAAMQVGAMAAIGNQLVIHDQLSQRLLRVDIWANQATVIGRSSGLAQWRLRAMPSTAVLLISPDSGQVRELGPDGSVRQVFDSIELTQPVDALFDPKSNMVVVIDLDGRLHEFSTLGGRHRTSDVLSDRGTAPRALVRGRDAFFLIDGHCQCLLELDAQGLPLRLFAEGEMALANDLAVDRYGRIWYLDGTGQTLHTIHADETSSTLRVATIGLGPASALTIADDQIFLAERGSGRILIFALPSPERRQ